MWGQTPECAQSASKCLSWRIVFGLLKGMKWLKWFCAMVALAVFCLCVFATWFDHQLLEDTKRFAYVREFARTDGGQQVLVTIGAEGMSPHSDACDAQIEIFVNDTANKEGFNEPGGLSVCEFAGLLWSSDNSVVAVIRRKEEQPDFCGWPMIFSCTNGFPFQTQEAGHNLQKITL